MTREEAIKILSREKECVQQALQRCADGSGYVSPDGMIRAADYVEACSVALAALRAQQEPEDPRPVSLWTVYEGGSMNDYIARADALSVAQYSKNPVEGIQNLPGVQFTRCAECRYSRELNRDDPVERKFVEGCVWCTERSDGMFRSGGCSEGLPGEAT